MVQLVSPGVAVPISDESAYSAPGSGTIPLILIATQQDKPDPTGEAVDNIAPYTKKENAGKVITATSQRDLTQMFGTAYFAEQEASETSEYGLLAAYSYLGQGSRAIMVRADVDMAQLEPSNVEPTGPVVGSPYWLDTSTSVFGIHEYDGSWKLKSAAVEPVTTATITVGNLTTDPADFDYLVVVHTPLTNNVPTEVTLNYYSSNGSAWSTTTGTISAHYRQPSSPSNGDVWVKLTSPGNGLNISVNQANSSGVFGNIPVQAMREGSIDITAFTPTTNANDLETEFTAAEHNFAVGDTIEITGFTSGNLGLNGVHKVIEVSGNDFTADVNSNGLTSAGADVQLVYYTQDGLSKDRIGVIKRPFVENNIVLDVTGDNVIELKVVDNSLAPASITKTFSENDNEPYGDPEAGQLWFDSTQTELDILEQNSGSWDRIDPNKIEYATEEPSASAYVVWVDTNAPENEYPKLYKSDGTNWIPYDNTDQSTDSGVLFDDFSNEDIDTDSNNYSSDRKTLVAANLFDTSPDPALYPIGMLAVNMAKSQNTVRVYKTEIPVNNDGTSTVDTWVNAAPNNANGSGSFGRKAQRRVVTTMMQAAVASNEELREEHLKYTLLCAPGYPELMDELVNLNTDRGETAFIITDAPMRETPNSVVGWLQGQGASENGEEGLVTKYTYSAVNYPSVGRATAPDGRTVSVPTSHMALYTYAYNDNIAYPWYAPAGLTRGVVRNGSAVGYINSEGEFKPVSLNQGQRDNLYANKINPIANFPLEGVVFWGQKSLHSASSALDRVNVGRLVAYIRERYPEILRPILFEQNTQATRNRAVQILDDFLADLVAKNGIEDYAVTADSSLNTPLRIARNELWIDSIILPVKAIEFIYAPIRLVTQL